MATSGSTVTAKVGGDDYGMSLLFSWSYSNGTVSWSLKANGGKSSNSSSYVHAHDIVLKINGYSQTIPYLQYCSKSKQTNCFFLRCNGDGADNASYGRTNVASGSFPIANGSTFTVYISAAIYSLSKNHERSITFTAGDPYTCYVRVNGEYKKGIPYVRVNGEYKQGLPYVRVGGEYKQGR